MDVLKVLQSSTAHLRVAIVHDWLVVRGGAEKVLDAFLDLFPEAEVFTVVDFMPQALRERLEGRRVHSSMIQRLPLARRYYRHYLPLMPYAIEQLDLRDFDLVISSSHAVAKGVLTHSEQRHVCYCHTPMRYAWDMKEAYLADAGIRFPPLEWAMRYALHRLRQWDYVTAGQVDCFLANSHNVAKRIDKFYRRSATVVHPPVDIEAFAFNPGSRDDYYLTASRMVPYKRQDLIIEAFRDMPERRLIVIGDGPERARLERLAEGADNIELRGFVPTVELQRYLANARGFVFAADEDFGIAPLEAQACGTPVIAYGHGGALETVRGAPGVAQPTGCFFEAQSVASLCAAIERFEASRFAAVDCRAQARRFAREAFFTRLHERLHDWLPAVA
ncbi:glycosyltransferase [Modicisalibacter tunisiensis]|uniref:glycosyltransferase n=1 Tax=Modicisalibacter tunisiensis TaxID=390637 RepID=UPI001CCFCE14|nr:glycosyltransferase [Modicisalibacter tunisiensis]MBZ9540431.1 glycosyltransferase [Modicisalibacter tunisiensis]